MRPQVAEHLTQLALGGCRSMGALALNGRWRIAAAGIAGLAAWLASASIARADVTAIVKFDLVEARVSPRQETIRNSITSSFRISADKGVDSAASTGLKSRRMNLGETSTGFNEAGQTMTSSMRIVGGAFVVTNHNPGFSSVLRITTDGRATCSATMKYFRIPGHPYFEAVTTDGSVSLLASSFTAENMTCSIGE
jgi:hypothetical protein